MFNTCFASSGAPVDVFPSLRTFPESSCTASLRPLSGGLRVLSASISDGLLRFLLDLVMRPPDISDPFCGATGLFSCPLSQLSFSSVESNSFFLNLRSFSTSSESCLSVIQINLLNIEQSTKEYKHQN